MTNLNEIKIYQIPSWRMDTLNEEIARLNKRADKLGCEHIEVITHEVKYIDDPNVMDEENPPKIAVHHVELKGNGPKLHGWKFLGTLDHSEYEFPIVKAVPGETIPTKYFHADGICDHCCTNRYRKETFILLHENGDYRQVGRSCIKDFLGHNPNRIASFLEGLDKLIALFGEFEESGFGGSGRMEWYFDKVAVLKTATALIRSFGWVSKARSRDEDISATADDVIFLMTPSNNHQESEAKERFRASVNWNEKDDLATAEGAIAWLAEQDSSKDYIHNLQLINTKDEITLKNFGFWCSLVSSYQRAMEQLNEKARIKNVNEWVGEIKKRQEFNVHVISIVPVEGYYGWTYIHKMVDTDGHTITWFASSRGELQERDDYTVVGTVKKHDKYNDWKQTTITRVKIK